MREEELVEEELVEHIAHLAVDPLGYTHFAYPWLEPGELEESAGPRLWQSDVLRSIGHHLQSDHRFTPLLIAVASGHGIGKSANIAQIIQWGMSTCTDCRVLVTANTGDQLTTKTIPEVSKWFRLAINSHWFDVRSESIKSKDTRHRETWRCDFLTWSLERPESFAGLHNKGRRIIVVFDEASSIPDKIWEVVEGALTDEGTEIIFVAYGNPTLNTGRFRECFGKNKHRWARMQIDSRTVDGTNKEQIDKWIADYGEDSDFVRVRVRGEFPRAGSAQFIASDVVAAARKRKVLQQGREWPILSVDVARFGDDQTIIGLRTGFKFEILEKLRGISTTQTAMRVMQRAVEITPRSIVIDGDGIGGGVIDYINEHFKDWLEQHPATRLVEFHGGHKPTDGYMYFNYRAECWGKMRAWLETGSIPDDPEVESDLTGPEYFFSSKNQIQLEKKDDMKKRGLASPDIADTLAMTFHARPLGLTQEEKDREKVLSLDDERAKFLMRYRLTQELAQREARLEDRPPEHLA